MITNSKAIKLDKILIEIFLSFLQKGKYKVPLLSKEQESLIIHISDTYLMSGFLINSCSFNFSHKNLVSQLKHQRKTQLMKQMIQGNDLHEIACKFNDSGIPFVVLKGVALNLDGVYQAGIRASRDIDILVDTHMIEEAYHVLKSLGFKYLDPNTHDSVKYRYGHHFPEMINKNNTKLELHWRVTHVRDFKNCPLTENIFMSRRVSKLNSNVFCPKIDITMSHILYHGLIKHQMNLGPIFLFDLLAIFIYLDKNWAIDEKSLNILGVKEKFTFCKNLIESINQKNGFSEGSWTFIKQIIDHSRWLQVNSKYRFSETLVRYKLVKLPVKDKSFETLLHKVRRMRQSYQLSYFSLKFYVLLIRNAFRFFKKIVIEKFY